MQAFALADLADCKKNNPCVTEYAQWQSTGRNGFPPPSVEGVD